MRLDFSNCGELKRTFCWLFQLIELADTARAADKTFWMHAGYNLHYAALLLCQNEQLWKIIIEFHLFVASPCFSRSSRTFNSSCGRWKLFSLAVVWRATWVQERWSGHKSSQEKIKAAPLGFVIYWVNFQPLWYISLPLLFRLLAKKQIKLDLCQRTQSVFICECSRARWSSVSWNQSPPGCCFI